METRTKLNKNLRRCGGLILTRPHFTSPHFGRLRLVWGFNPTFFLKPIGKGSPKPPIGEKLIQISTDVW